MAKTETEHEEKVQVVVSNDTDQFMKSVKEACKGKIVLSKHYSAQTHFMQPAAPLQGIQMNTQPQAVVLLHCVILYREETKKVIN